MLVRQNVLFMYDLFRNVLMDSIYKYENASIFETIYIKSEI